MSTVPTLISVAEYLGSTYHPDRDFVDGELLERNVGETPHGKLQMLFGWYFFSQKENWRVSPSAEQRVQISSSRYRIPDVCVISDDAPDELVLRTPPVLCIEILSRSDSMTDILTRVDEYLSIGVAAVWVIDPWLRKAFYALPDGSLQYEPGMLTVKGSPIAISVPELFQRLFPAGR